MEREILFRGKRADNGEWMYGDLVLSAGYPDRAWLVESKTFVDKQIHGVGVREVDPATVGQYTGLTDRNGTKIFEGDVIQHEVSYHDGKTVAREMQLFKIKYSAEQARFLAVLTNGVFNPAAMQNCEIVGNIHDSLELMEMIP